MALDHLNLSIEEEEASTSGPNRSRKTTAINCMLSLLKYDKEIRLFREKMAPDRYDLETSGRDRASGNVAVFEELTVYEKY